MSDESRLPLPRGVTRRDALKMGLATGAATTFAAAGGIEALAAPPTQLNEATVAGLQAAMGSGRLSSKKLVDFYINRIEALDQGGPGVNSVIELNPDARSIAESLDAERHHQGPRGPLHGIPVLLKDNIGTHDRMQTAAGSLALVGTPARDDSTVAKNLREAGAVILGKTTLSEWANFRSFTATSGWSGRGGQCNNPYLLDYNPCGSSSGSAAAASANFTAVSLGSETDGSIVCPANHSGVVGLKPTVGLVSRAGVVPISHTQDTIGPHTRTVADAAAVLGAIQSRTFDGRDAATGGVPLGWRGVRTRPTDIPRDYTQFLNPNGLHGARLGVWEAGMAAANQNVLDAFNQATAAMQAAGATLVTVDFPHADDLNSGAAEFLILLYDFKLDLDSYLATRVGVPIHNLDDAIAFNNAHAAREMPFFAQEIFLSAQAMDTSSPDAPQDQFGGMTYNQALDIDQKAGGTEGIDQLLRDFNLDAIISATEPLSWATDLVYGDRFTFGTSSPCAIVGYPIISVPSGFVLHMPLGISFMGTAFSEPKLIKLASGFEHVYPQRRAPRFLDSLPANALETAPGPAHGKGARMQLKGKRPARI
ncbi:MAG: amidase [Chloroflexota bacterium]|nr:amidase [Chloroflexota bacterium]